MNRQQRIERYGWALIGGLVLGAGCHGGSSYSGGGSNSANTSPAPQAPIGSTLAGAWAGAFKIDGSSATAVSATITLNVTSLAGTYRLNSGAIFGTFNGTWNGSVAALTVAQTFPCSATFRGTGRLDPSNSKAGTISFSGTDCTGMPQSGMFTLNRA